MKKKTLTVALAVVLVLCCAVGATLAWLTDTTDPVTNTFTVGDINIDLTETTNNYKMVPGNTIAKDPTVTVEAGSEACWLFVKVEESANFGSFLAYSIADGWTALEGQTGVYYREVAAPATDQEFAVLKDNQVTVKNTVTKEMLTAENFAYPTLTFTAYAVQKDNVATAADAWEKLFPSA
ncbi:MAG: SipW-dependent-type signal peptide-containing protein [Anaerovoracaceae bacterium]